MYVRMPMYGFGTAPRNIKGSSTSQKTVADVTNNTPSRLTQLFERYTTGDSQPRLGEPEEMVINAKQFLQGSRLVPAPSAGDAC